MQSTAVYKNSRRNYGIDLLRLVSMFLVVILHVLGHGGVLTSTTGGKHHVAWLFETMAYCAVDVYAIISGFVSFTEKEKPYRYTKFFSFWFQIFTYNFLITFIAFLLNPGSIGVRDLIITLFPIATSTYWYVSAYAGLFFIIPWLNKLMRSCSKREATHLVTVVLVVFVGYVTFSNYFSDCFSLGKGYSFVWLSLLYIVGAWLKKCNIPKLFNNKFFLLGILICIVFSWVTHEFVVSSVFSIFIAYNSFTIVFVAIALVCVFSKLQIGFGFSKIIACFAPAAFGVYLIHVHPIIWDRFMASAFVWIAEYSIFLLPILVLVSAFCVFLICILIEKARLILFELLRINKFTSFVENKIDSLVNKTVEKIKSKA